MTATDLAGNRPTFSLTRTMRQVLLVIQELTALDGVPPSYDEIARECCLVSRGRAHGIVGGLVERGYLERLPSQPRSLLVLRPLPMPEEPEIELTPAGIAAARRGGFP